jgi:integrase
MPYLRKQKDRYFATWDIPEKHRPMFKGKRRLTKTTGTGDKKLAQRKAYQIVEGWKQRAEGTYWDWVAGQLPEDGTTVPVGEIEGETIYEPFDREKWMGDLAWQHDLEIDDDFKAAAGDFIRLKDHIDRWFEQLKTTPKTNDQKKLDVSSFIEEFPYAHLVNRRKLKEFLESQGKATTSLKRALGSIKDFWQYVEIELDKDLGDPFKNLTAVGKPKLEKQAFSYDEICSIYESLRDDGQKLLVQIAALTGMRIEEICTSTFEQEHIVVHESKTKAGLRDLPLHSTLDAKVITEMQGRLKAGAYGRLSHTIGKDLNRHITNMGFGPKKTFHSIRKYVATCFENNGVEELIAARILGHNLKTMSYGLYSGGADVDRLRPAIEELKSVGSTSA